MTHESIKDIVTPPKTIAVVGLSDNPTRPSFSVASYLQEHGFTIIPVNPNLTEVLGVLAYPSLLAIPKEIHIDIVEIFRRPEEVPALVQEVIDSGRHPIIWMQEGVISPEGRKLAQEHGMQVIMNACMKKAHMARN